MLETCIFIGNQQGSPLINQMIDYDPSETTRRAPFKKELMAYLQGALHDAYRARGSRIRFSQKYVSWLENLKSLFSYLGYKSWIYCEGKRDVYVLETTANFLDFGFSLKGKTKREQIGYIRGFFDAEGGIPHKKSNRFYIQFVQKDKNKLEMISACLLKLGIESGKVHTPSKKIDPEYWRFYIRAKSYKDFCKIIYSWHSVKSTILQERVKI